MGGWGRGIINITPSGKVLPCHAAESIPGLAFENVRERPLRDIWLASDAFQKFRGIDWMREPCRSCELREVDWGGCRCQALAFTGAAEDADPACAKSAHHAAFTRIAEDEAAAPAPDFIYRRPQRQKPALELSVSAMTTAWTAAGCRPSALPPVIARTELARQKYRTVARSLPLPTPGRARASTQRKAHFRSSVPQQPGASLEV